MKNKRRQPTLKTLSLAYRTIGGESKWIQAGSKGIHSLWSSGFQREGKRLLPAALNGAQIPVRDPIESDLPEEGRA